MFAIFPFVYANVLPFLYWFKLISQSIWRGVNKLSLYFMILYCQIFDAAHQNPLKVPMTSNGRTLYNTKVRSNISVSRVTNIWMGIQLQFASSIGHGRNQALTVRVSKIRFYKLVWFMLYFCCTYVFSHGFYKFFFLW